MASRADGREHLNSVDVAVEIVAAVRVLSRHRLGATLLLDPAMSVEDGVVLDARVSRELLVALFVPEYLNQLHRGAVVVREDRVERAGVPISCAEVIKRAADFAAVVAIAVDEDFSRTRIADRSGRVEVVEVDEFATALGRRRR